MNRRPNLFLLLLFFLGCGGSARALGSEPQSCPEIVTKARPERVRDWWNSDRVKLAITSLHTQFPDLHLGTTRLSRCKDEAVLSYLRQVLGRDVTFSALVQAGAQIHGGWEQALAANGLEPATYSNNIRWSEARIIELLKALYADQICLAAHAIAHDNSPAFGAISKKIFFRAITGAVVYNKARAHFGSWEKALAAAGITMAMVELMPRSWNAHATDGEIPLAYLPQLPPEWSWAEVIDVIRRLGADKRISHPARMGRDTSDEGLQTIESVTGKKITIAEFYRMVVRVTNGWSAIVNLAGLDAAALLYKRDLVAKKLIAADETGHAPTDILRLKFLALIREAYARKICLRSSAIGRDTSPLFQDLALEIIGQRINGRVLYVRSREIFDDWDEALRQAGLDPDVVHFMPLTYLSYRTLENPLPLQALPALPAAWSWEKVVGVMKYLSLHRRLYYGSKMAADESVELSDLIEQSSGNRVTGKEFYALVRNYSGAWAAMMPLADLDPLDFLSRIVLSPARVIQLVRELHRAGRNTSLSAVLDDKQKIIPATALAVLRRSLSGKQVALAGMRHFHHWSRVRFLAQAWSTDESPAATWERLHKLSISTRDTHAYASVYDATLFPAPPRREVSFNPTRSSSALFGDFGPPALPREEQTAWFNRFAYLKFLAKDRLLLLKAASQSPDWNVNRHAETLAEVLSFLEEAEEIKNLLWEHNLRLIPELALEVGERFALDPMDVALEATTELNRIMEYYDPDIAGFYTFARGCLTRSLNTWAGQQAQVRRFERHESSFSREPDSESLLTAIPAHSEVSSSNGIDVWERLRPALARLEPHEREVLTLSFGLEGLEPRTYDEISVTMGMRRDQVARLKKQALRRLYALADATSLEEFLNP